MSAPSNRTEKEFWETEYYWGSAEQERDDPMQPADRSLAAALERHAAASPGERVLEIGCAPAKWLALYARRFGAEVSGIEYSSKGVAVSRETLAAAGVAGDIIEADFFAVDPRPYDLVLSFGFLEHFDDLDAVFARHVDFVRPGGRLVVQVPNFRGLNGAVQSLADPAYLALHNTAAMSRDALQRLAAGHGLRPLHLGYLGGFDPSLLRLGQGGPRWHPRRAIPAAVALAGHRLRRLAAAERADHRLWSTYLMGVWERPLTA